MYIDLSIESIQRSMSGTNIELSLFVNPTVVLNSTVNNNITEKIGYPFTFEDFTPEQLLSLKGDKGDDGAPGQDGANGTDGLDGAPGAPGKSAYQSYLDTTTDNPPLSEAEWSNQLAGVLTILNSI